MRRRRSSASRDGFDRGSIAVIVAAAFVPLTMAMAVVADGGRVWMEKQNLQNEVEASALAVAQSSALGGTSCAPSALSLVPSGATCSTTTTSNGSVATVEASDDVNLYFAQLLGRSSAGIDASASVRLGPASAASGLRPIALCVANESFQSWLASGMTSTATYTIGVEDESSISTSSYDSDDSYVDSDDECGTDVPGNWGVLDFDGGANSMSDAQNWIVNGYPGSVSVGETLDGDPGIPSPALNLDEVAGQSVVLPVFANPRLEGANATYDVVGFVKVRIVEVNLTGSASNRNVKVVFEKGTVKGTPGDVTTENFGVSSWAVCSFDGRGVCS